MEPDKIRRLGPPNEEVFLDEHDLSRRHKRSIKTIRNARLRGGSVPFVKIGRLVRYRLSDVVAWEQQTRLRNSTSDEGGSNA
jgi:hypothetical protein